MQGSMKQEAPPSLRWGSSPYILLNKGLDYSLFGKIKDFTHEIK